MNAMRGAAHLVMIGIIAILFTIVLCPTLAMGRRGARFTARLWTQASLALLQPMCGVRVSVEGAENLPEGPAIVAANHQSAWETLFLFSRLSRPAFVVKQELLDIPVFGFWLKRTGALPIDRKAGARTLKRMTAAARARLEDGEQIVIFPEGTRAPPGVRPPLHPGVAAIYAAGAAPCIPVAHDSGRRWRHPGPERTPGVITVRILPAIPPGLDRRVFLKALDQKLAAARPDLARPAPAPERAMASAV